MSVLRDNKFALYKYSIEKKFEAGLRLSGKQVKLIRNHDYELRESIFKIDPLGRLWIENLFPHHKDEKVQMLLNANEISKIQSLFKSRKYHGFILNLHSTSKNLIKADIAVGTIKKKSEKKSAERSTQKREFEREYKI